MTWIQWFSVSVVAFVVACMGLTAYWLHGAELYNRSADAYRRGDIAAGDALRRRAERWSVGARS